MLISRSIYAVQVPCRGPGLWSNELWLAKVTGVISFNDLKLASENVCENAVKCGMARGGVRHCEHSVNI